MAAAPKGPPAVSSTRKAPGGQRAQPVRWCGRLGSPTVWLFQLAVLGGCVRAAGTVAQPTAIERQLLGAYQELDETLVMEASVRSERELRAAPTLRHRALRARLLQRFNQDDLRELKSRQCVAETPRARLRPVPCEAVRQPPWSRIRARVLREENRSRQIILEWAAARLAAERSAGPVDDGIRAEVRAAYRELVEESASPGDLFETPSGSLRPKEQP